MTRKVIMPVLGETMDEGTISKWNKAVGDKVEKGEALLAVESDKALLDVESFVNGYLRKILTAQVYQVAVRLGPPRCTRLVVRGVAGQVRGEGGGRGICVVLGRREARLHVSGRGPIR